MRVTIAVPTYRRPETLHALLRSLESLTFVKVPEPNITVVVVDNDCRGTAAGVLRRCKFTRYEVRYRVESAPGVSHARNRCLREACGSDFVAFIDDDETASTSWLDELLTAQIAFERPMVAGPIVPRYDAPPPSWCLEGKFHRRRRYRTGTLVESTSAGNLLLSRRILDAIPYPWFDPSFSRSGGEDTHFLRRCASLGYRAVWADDAIVYEKIPEERLARDFLLRRARDGGNHWSRVDLDLGLPAWRLALRFGTGLLRVVQGSTLSPCSPFLSPAQHLRAQMRLAEGLGNLSAFFGRSFTTYRPEQ